jgi:putative ABC transport system ATP-binding protein/lipoprotein-releasing system ATP-binding protein
MAGSSMADSIVEASHLFRIFGTGVRQVAAVIDATCTISPGDRVAVIGPSGGGKSSLLHLLAGLDEPSSGNLVWPALGPRSDLRPAKLAVVFQSPSLLPSLTAQENVALPLLLIGREREAERRAAEALDRLGLGDLAGKLPQELSGGQAQRVAMARALCVRPNFIIADEPTGQLDQATANSLLDRVLEAIGSDIALLIATHDEAIAARMSKVWHMKGGLLDTTASS